METFNINFLYIVISFQCWNSCDQNLGPFPLHINSATIDRNTRGLEVHISWDERITNTSKQCLVTWEVSGGGLMGNLLTDGSTVELSLWSDTIYHVQVTCKNKVRRAFLFSPIPIPHLLSIFCYIHSVYAIHPYN